VTTESQQHRETIAYRPIGVLRTPFQRVEGMPIQPPAARGVEGFASIEPEYRDGLRDVEGFSHVVLLYHFHRAAPAELLVRPFLDDSTPRGVFATRAPRRPNAIGLSMVRLLEVRADGLALEDVDMLDGTPLLDLKPYVAAFDHREGATTGWYGARAAAVQSVRSDGRFVNRSDG
jgi:tRNA-Thr(GGU) m(6)t(6)A37 methyltransferase TsaA